MKYYVEYRLDARYTTCVEADSIEEALKEAEDNYCDANFGEAKDIEGEPIIVEDAETD